MAQFDYDEWLEGVSNRVGEVEILLNGEKTRVPEGLTILGLLHHLSLDPSRVAVEFDGAIVKAPAWPSTSLHEGAQVEIVQFVGGG